MREGIDCHQIKWVERKLYAHSPEYTNQVFGYLTALFPAKETQRKKKAGWICKCECGNEFFATTEKLTTGNTRSCGCQHYTSAKQRWSKYRENLIGEKINNLEVISYEGQNEHNVALYKFRCVCGNEFVRTYRSIKGNDSQDCGCGRIQNTKDYIDSFIGKRFGHLVVLRYLETIKSGIYNFECQCDCGNTTISNNDTLRKGSKISCGCIRSVGENRIAAILKENNISFQQEISFPNLISILGGHPRYDFALFDENHNITRLIEFDGKQHEKTYNYFGGKEKFQKIQNNDSLKNAYALEHHIPLVRIPYSEKDNLSLSLLLSDKYLITE